MELIELTGTILHLQRLSTEDGPGIRTTVFFKGCPLHCQWCHNPESISTKKQVQWMGVRCIGCDSCIEVCEEHGLTHTEEGIMRDRQRCVVCGRCVEACPSGAMEMLGRELGVRELVTELLKDRTYFEKSGGGVTLSGGEPTLQPAFCGALMDTLHENGIPVALDTCGLCTPAVFRPLAGMADIILYDLKLFDNAEHHHWTGVDNHHILENLAVARDVVAESNNKKRLWIRTPLIPGATDSQANLSAIGAYLASMLDGQAERWELCAFNNLCRDKYERLGLEWQFAGAELYLQTELDQFEGWAKSSGFDPARIFITGAAKTTG